MLYSCLIALIGLSRYFIKIIILKCIKDKTIGKWQTMECLSRVYIILKQVPRIILTLQLNDFSFQVWSNNEYSMIRSLCILVLSFGAALSIDTFLSTPGDPVILVFLDLHQSYHDNACTDRNLETFDIAFRLYWDAMQTNTTGNWYCLRCRFCSVVIADVVFCRYS